MIRAFPLFKGQSFGMLLPEGDHEIPCIGLTLKILPGIRPLKKPDGSAANGNDIV